MLRHFLSWLAAVLLLGNGPVHSETPARTLNEAASRLATVTSQNVREFSTQDFGREQYTKARSALVPANEAETLLGKVRNELGPGLIAFIGTQHSLAAVEPDGVELVVAEGTTQFDILRVAASDAVNFGKETEDLIAVLQKWDAEFGIDIYQAATDTVQLRLKSLPADMKKFSQDVYEFCPDIVDQGTGSVRELRKAIVKSHQLFLWWD